MTAQHTCAGKIFRGYRYYSCSNKASHEHEGTMYCKTHHPPTVQAKREKKLAEYEAESRRRAASYKAEADAKAEMKRRAECFPDLLEALQALDAIGVLEPDLIGIGEEIDHAVGLARAAIQKATKEQV